MVKAYWTQWPLSKINSFAKNYGWTTRRHQYQVTGDVLFLLLACVLHKYAGVSRYNGSGRTIQLPYMHSLPCPIYSRICVTLHRHTSLLMRGRWMRKHTSSSRQGGGERNFLGDPSDFITLWRIYPYHRCTRQIEKVKTNHMWKDWHAFVL